MKKFERWGADLMYGDRRANLHWGLLALAAADRVKLQSTFEECRTHVLNISKRGGSAVCSAKGCVLSSPLVIFLQCAHHWQRVKDAERWCRDWGLLTLAAADRVKLALTQFHVPQLCCSDRHYRRDRSRLSTSDTSIRRALTTGSASQMLSGGAATAAGARGGRLLRPEAPEMSLTISASR